MERFLNDLEHNLHEEEGFSTVGVALALLITLALIFTAAQVYEIESVSADIQEVADVAVLAAENTVGEYCVVACLCDGIALSLSLSSLCCLGLSIAAACTPVTATLSETLWQTAQKLKQTQISFVEKAQDALERLKLILPLAAAAKAKSVIDANSGLRGEASYTGIAILVPWQTDPLEATEHRISDSAFEEAEEKRGSIEDLGEKAEEASREANAFKKAAYQFDSGSTTSYCMYERAKTLAHLNGQDNPYYSSAETWDFDVALTRAQTYYRTRAQIESPSDSSIAERARSALRKKFYQYASDELSKGYVERSDDSFEAFFPRLPKNTEEMKGTTLYTDASYPVSTSTQGKRILHAFEGCPMYVQNMKDGYGSLAQADGNAQFEKCPQCQLDATSMGSVAAASSSIDNGFEYHYLKVADLARSYQEAQQRASESSQALKEQAKELLKTIGEAIEEADNERIKIDPPGKYGAVAFVMSSEAGKSNFVSQFIESTGQLRTRVALSGATLLPESTESGKNAINSILDGYAEAGLGSSITSARIALDLWSALLSGYGEAQECLTTSLSNAIDAIPLASESGLGPWAAECLESIVEGVGLHPVDLSPQKAVLVNTAHIGYADESAFGARLIDLKIANLGRNSIGEVFSNTLDSAESAVTDMIDNADFTIEIATIEIIQGAVEIPITITLPSSIKDAANDSIRHAFSLLEDRLASFTFDRRWK
jgi:hypothetical protein